MNKKLILRHKANRNPYGLYSPSYFKPMTRQETIDFFNEIEITDEELRLLNEYVLEDPKHTFYDNAYSVWEESGSEMNFIDGLRMREIIDEDMRKQMERISYEAKYEAQSWEASITHLEFYQGYVSLIFEGRGSAIKCLIGRTRQELWICMLDWNVCTTLAHPEDILWNHEAVSSLMKSFIDGATIAYGIRELYQRDFIGGEWIYEY